MSYNRRVWKDLPSRETPLTADALNNIELGILNAHKMIGELTSGVGSLHKVATSGDYRDLSNKPSIPDISGKADKSELSAYVKSASLHGVATSGNYAELNNKPTIPDISGKADKSELSAYAKTASLHKVATSGRYTDLLNKPTIPDVSGKADRSELAAYAKTSSLHTVATSGSYTDLKNKPSIPERGFDILEAPTGTLDFNTQNEPGFYFHKPSRSSRISNGPSGLGTGNAFLFSNYSPRDKNYGAQVVNCHDGPEGVVSWVRVKNSGTWSAWELFSPIGFPIG